jgi:hypothetical protein
VALALSAAGLCVEPRWAPRVHKLSEANGKICNGVARSCDQQACLPDSRKPSPNHAPGLRAASEAGRVRDRGPQGSSSKVQSGCTSSREDARAQTWSLAKEDFRRATSCIARDDWQAILLRQETAMTTERRQRRQLAAEQQPAPAADGLMLASTDGACTLDVLRIRA